LKVFYHSHYISAAYAFDTTRKAAAVAKLVAQNPTMKLVAPIPATDEQIRRCHDGKYMTAVATGHPRDLAESNCFTWCPNTYRAVTYSNGGVISAAKQAVKDGVAGTLSSGLHHARRDRGAGFCTFNGLAMAAMDAIEAGYAESVLIIDFDAHYGDGTADLISGCRHIHQVDVSTHRIPTNSDYMSECRKALESVEDDDFDLVLYNAGMDPHEDCRIGGLKGVTSHVLAQRDALVFDWCHDRRSPVAFTLAGGYSGDKFTPDELARCHYNTCLQAVDAYHVYA
jgi:acetoin utilization deacetylase AcuC-like enzyme